MANPVSLSNEARYPFLVPGGRGPDDLSAGAPPRLSLWQRLLLVLPRLKRDQEKAPLGDRLRNAVVKPVEPDAASTAKVSDEPLSVEELEAAVRSADDKERLIGLFAAPVAAAIGILVISALISNDPPAFLKNGQVNKLHVSLSLYHDLTVVLLGLSVLMLVTAWFRKRLYLAILMALYGLAVFNLHYWGFGIPFLLGGSWLLVRSYRLQRDLREATGETPSRPGARQRRGGATATMSRPQPNKRYTPPVSPSKR
ncbi:MAG: hypothetical protein ABSC00_01190 [Acidimicrobiales bacterium]|jgi:hypothetical protein